jgi:hypothetical protein
MDNDVGQIHSIKIWHDNAGLQAAWFLDTVVIRKKYSVPVIQSFNERANEISQVFYQRADKKFRQFLSKTPSNQTEGNHRIDYYETSHDQYRNGSSILLDPATDNRRTANKHVTWQEKNNDNVRHTSSHESSRRQPRSAESSRNDMFDQLGHIEHHAYWISSHRFIDDAWIIESIEEKDRALFDSSTRSRLLADRSVMNKKNKSSTSDIDDDVYEFTANRWLGKDEGDHKIEVILQPNSVKLSAATTMKYKTSSSDINKDNQLRSSARKMADIRSSSIGDDTFSRRSPVDNESNKRITQSHVLNPVHSHLAARPETQPRSANMRTNQRTTDARSRTELRIHEDEINDQFLKHGISSTDISSQRSPRHLKSLESIRSSPIALNKLNEHEDMFRSPRSLIDSGRLTTVQDRQDSARYGKKNHELSVKHEFETRTSSSTSRMTSSQFEFFSYEISCCHHHHRLVVSFAF